MFETATTPCPTPKTNQNLRTLTYTHIRRHLGQHPTRQPPQDESTKSANPHPYTWSYLEGKNMWPRTPTPSLSPIRMLKWKSIKLVGQTQEKKLAQNSVSPNNCCLIPNQPHEYQLPRLPVFGFHPFQTAAWKHHAVLAPAAPIQRRPLCAEVSPQSRPPWHSKLLKIGWKISSLVGKTPLSSGGLPAEP